jgi:hypothetical protein
MQLDNLGSKKKLDMVVETVWSFLDVIKKELAKPIEVNYVVNYSNQDLHYLVVESEKEKNPDMKLMLQMLYLHSLMCTLMEEEAHITYDGEKEILTIDKPTTYSAFVITQKEGEKKDLIFAATVLMFALESKFNKHLYVGLDFEYTAGIALAQICFEYHPDTRQQIFIIGPPKMDPVIYQLFVDLIVVNPAIRKILHGSDARDMPYIVEEMLKKDKDKITDFIKGLVDTRFLCEFLKASQNDALTHKCNIYEAIGYFGLITEKQQKEIETNLEDLGPPQNLKWNVNMLADSQMHYAILDVLYLKKLYYQIMKIAYDEASLEVRPHIMFIYKQFLYQLTQFIYLENDKINVTDLLVGEKLECDQINNYFIKIGTTTHTLTSIYKKIEQGIMIGSIGLELALVYKVNYFKSKFKVLVMKILYSVLTHKYQVRSGRDKIIDKKEALKLDRIFHYFREHNFEHLAKFTREFRDLLHAKIHDIMTKN